MIKCRLCVESACVKCDYYLHWAILTITTHTILFHSLSLWSSVASIHTVYYFYRIAYVSVRVYVQFRTLSLSLSISICKAGCQKVKIGRYDNLSCWCTNLITKQFLYSYLFSIEISQRRTGYNGKFGGKCF